MFEMILSTMASLLDYLDQNGMIVNGVCWDGLCKLVKSILSLYHRLLAHNWMIGSLLFSLRHILGMHYHYVTIISINKYLFKNYYDY